MPIQIVMPTLSPTMDKGKLAKWRVKEGQQVKAGDVICEVETDKATIEVEAVDSRQGGEAAGGGGTADVKVNTPIAYLDGEATSSRRSRRPDAARWAVVRPLSSPRSEPGDAPQPHPDVVPTARRDAQSAGGPARRPAPSSAAPRLKGDHAAAAGRSRQAQSRRRSAWAQRCRRGKDPATSAPRASRPTRSRAGWWWCRGPAAATFAPSIAGMNSVGRDASQRISLSFGDESISREEHAFITYDEEQRCFYLQHGGKPNIIRLGATPVLTSHGAQAVRSHPHRPHHAALHPVLRPSASPGPKRSRTRVVSVQIAGCMGPVPSAHGALRRRPARDDVGESEPLTTHRHLGAARKRQRAKRD